MTATVGDGLGLLDDVRLYNRALPDAEVQALFVIESGATSGFRQALATATVVNGFVVGFTVVDGGSGYPTAPLVAISGAGTGATGTATVSNGVVTAIAVGSAGSGYTGPTTVTIAAPPQPSRQATASAVVVNGFVVGFTVTDPGSGYTNNPVVLIVGGGGTGATAAATVNNGVVTGIQIVTTGSGYTSTPVMRIASPPFLPKLAIEVSRVNVKLNVVLGRRYQLQSSDDFLQWTNVGSTFVAQDENLVSELIVGQTGRFFRVQEVP